MVAWRWRAGKCCGKCGVVGFALFEVPGRLWWCWLGVIVLGACGGVGDAHD